VRDSGASRTVDVAGFSGRVDPVADVDAGKCRPQRLGHLADGHANRTGKAAIELHVQLRLLPLGGQADVHRAGHLPDFRHHGVSKLGELGRVASLELQLNLLLSLVEAGTDRRRHAGELRSTAADVGNDGGLRPRPVLFRRQLDEDSAFVHSLTLATHRDVGVAHLGLRARDARHLLCFRSRVGQVRPGRRFESTR
jgi:hypothetical protein